MGLGHDYVRTDRKMTVVLVSDKLRKSIIYMLTFVSLLWLVKIVEESMDFDLGIYGIYPRTLGGSLGIITGPLVHGDIYHLMSNTFPILILGVGILYFYDKVALWVFALIYLMTGFWVWMAARSAYHIGASGLVYGMLFFLLLSGFIRRDLRTLAISFIVLFIYGGSLFTGFIPTSEKVSWESHILGAIAGAFCALYFRRVDIFTAESEPEEIDDSSRYLPAPSLSSSWGLEEHRPLKVRYTFKKKRGIAPVSNKGDESTRKTPPVVYSLVLDLSKGQPGFSDSSLSSEKDRADGIGPAGLPESAPEAD